MSQFANSNGSITLFTIDPPSFDEPRPVVRVTQGESWKPTLHILQALKRLGDSMVRLCSFCHSAQWPRASISSKALLSAGSMCMALFVFFLSDQGAFSWWQSSMGLAVRQWQRQAHADRIEEGITWNRS